MNIFVLDYSPIKSAIYMCDKHVVKMIVESAQMLCTNLHEFGECDDIPYRPCFRNHPCTIWARHSAANYMWLCTHAKALCAEYTFRYHKAHKTEDIIDYCIDRKPKALYGNDLSPFAQCMPEQYKRSECVVTAYRLYYRGEKPFAKWQRGRNEPYWWSTL